MLNFIGLKLFQSVDVESWQKYPPKTCLYFQQKVILPRKIIIYLNGGQNSDSFFVKTQTKKLFIFI